MLSIANDFSRYFELEFGASDELVARCQRLRYQIFCQEQQLFDAKNYNDYSESDEYDCRSVHGILSYRRTKIDIATVRIILCDKQQPEQPFPVEKFQLLRRSLRDKNWRVPRHSLGEISRFSVLKYFRRRHNDSFSPHGISEALCDYDWHTLNRWYPHITLGLFRLVTQMSRAYDVHYWYANMEPKLIRILARVGIEFISVGPLVEYLGLRQPCFGRVDDILSGINQKRPEVLHFINGALGERKHSPAVNRVSTRRSVHTH